MNTKTIHTDLLIIGGGTAGCFGAIKAASSNLELSISIFEKANIKRSGCLAAGVNAINAFITPGQVPQDYVDYAKTDAEGIVREDLLLSMSEKLNQVTHDLEDMGLVILKDENGDYVTRGKRNIKINGENIKLLLAAEVARHKNITVYNHVNIIGYLVKDQTIYGAYGFDIKENVFYEIFAKKVMCATGGASGLYRPNNPGFSRHKMWYPPFNTGAGYAMGILAGAEMTTFEMRFIALRCKDTIAPTGTLAQGVHAKQINSLGEVYETKYGNTTSQRVYGTVKETVEGRGPCYLETIGIGKEAEESLMKAYLNMAPSQTLKWMEDQAGPNENNVEIEGTEPYIMGGHTASGYWVDNKRETTIKGLFAAGDVAGGCPQKYVTGALVEGEIAAMGALRQIQQEKQKESDHSIGWDDFLTNRKKELEAYFQNETGLFSAEDLEEAMQKVMDTYAGGISTHYQFNENQLAIARVKIEELENLTKTCHVEDIQELMHLYELKERLVLCQSVIAHLSARKETRWHCFAENLSYPEKSSDWEKYVNSVWKDGKLTVSFRNLVGKGEVYEH